MAGGISATRVRLLSTGWEIQASPAEGFDFQVTESHSLPSQIAVSGSARNTGKLRLEVKGDYVPLLALVEEAIWKMRCRHSIDYRLHKKCECLLKATITTIRVVSLSLRTTSASC